MRNRTSPFLSSPRDDLQFGTLGNQSCTLSWTTNSTDGSGHWRPFYRIGSLPPAPTPAPSPSPAPADVYMGYTMITRMEASAHLVDNNGSTVTKKVGEEGIVPVMYEYRYTEWPLWKGRTVVVWSDLVGTPPPPLQRPWNCV
jgi:hypothetical protein